VLGGLRYEHRGFQVGGSVQGVADQTRVFGDETPTDGYTTFRLFGSYSFSHSGVLHTITARLDNAGNELYRNHLNYLKDVLPEIGRAFKAVYALSF
jgi:iron complex outermembrane receptor protein